MTVVFLITLALLYPIEAPATDRVAKAWWDFGHLPLFALFAYAVVGGRGVPRGRRIAGLVLLAGLVVAVEWLQRGLGREFSRTDMMYGFAGVLVTGIVCFVPWRKIAVFGAVGLVIGVAAVGPLRIAYDRWQVARAYPVLAGFDRTWEPTRWQVQGVRIERDGEGWFAVVESSAYPGLFLADLPRDWRDVRSVRIEIVYEGKGERPILWWRMDDRPGAPAYHERFEAGYPVTHGFNLVQVGHETFSRKNEGGVLDLSSITTAGVFMTGVNAGDRLRILRIELLH